MNALSSSLFSDILVVFAVLGMLGTVVMAAQRLWAAGQREVEQARERSELAAAYAELAAAKQAAEVRAAELTMTLEGMAEAVMLTDADMNLMQWNSRWTEVAGVPAGLLRPGSTIEDLLRAQAISGEFGAADVEGEVNKRLTRLRTFGPEEDIWRDRPNGRRMRMRRRVLSNGYMVSVASDVTGVSRDVPVPQARPAETVPPRGLRRCFVLLVEDIVVNQVVTATQLRRDGQRVDVASSGAEALEMMRARPYDIVLMDLMMPGMSGIEATEAIRLMPGFVGEVPILELTATAGEKDRARCLEAGMQGMLSKPVRSEELTDAIAGVLAPGARRPVRNATPAPAAAREAVRDGLLDLPRLEDLRGGLPAGLFAELAQQCVVDMRERMMELHEALELGVFDRIDAAAHALAGMAGSYGMAAVERRMRRIMEAARLHDGPMARGAAVAMTEELLETEASLRSVVGGGA